jgi:heme/copper-type cytochrome/quinol oxidase subunit 4
MSFGKDLLIGIVVGLAIYFALDLLFFFLLPEIAAATLFFIKLGIFAAIVAVVVICLFVVRSRNN